MKLLAIDDKPDNLVALAAMLRTYLPGCEVATARSGSAGVEKARAFEPDTILLDIQMPGMDGFEACRILKGDPATRHIPIIFLTAQNADPASRIHGLEIGGDAFLAKPVEPGELMAQVRAMVRIKQAEDVLRGEKHALERLVDERTATLRDRDEWHRIILQAAMDGFWLADMDGRILEVNETYCKMSGYSMRELRAMRIPDLEAIEKAEDTFAHSDKVMAQGEDRFESRHRRKDGTLFDVEVSVQYRPLEGGRLVAFLRDITESKRAERALEAGERRFRSVLETMSLIGVMLDLDGNITLCNDYLLHLTGWSREEVFNKNWFDLFVPPEIRGEIRQEVFLKTIGTGTVPAHHQNEIITRAGERRLVEWSNTVIRNPQGDAIGVASIGQDITDRKRAEEALRASEERFALFMRNLPGVAVIRDLEGRYVYMNEAWERAMGLRGKDYLGKSPYDSFPREDALRLIEDDRRLVESGEGLETEMELHHASGPRWWLVNRFLLEGAPGRPPYVAALYLDITDRKRAEEALRASEEKYRDLVESISDVIFEVDDRGAVVYISPAIQKVLGYQPEDILGRPFAQFVHPEDRGLLSRRFAELAGGIETPLEYRVSSKSGETRWVRTRTRPVLRDGTFSGARGTLADVTDRKRAEDALKVSEEKFRKAFETGPDAININRLEDGLYVSINQGFTQIMGYSEDETIGRTSRELDIWDRPEDRKETSQ